jgi:hypothetical protein
VLPHKRDSTRFEKTTVGLATSIRWRRRWDRPGKSVHQILAFVHQSLVAQFDLCYDVSENAAAAKDGVATSFCWNWFFWNSTYTLGERLQCRPHARRPTLRCRSA